MITSFFFFVAQDIFKQATEDRLTSAKELPYFEGDFWPNVLEESIKELEQEEEERKREENSTSNESTDVSSRIERIHMYSSLWHSGSPGYWNWHFNVHRPRKETARTPKRRTIKRRARTRAAWAEPIRRSQGCLMFPMTCPRNSTPPWRNIRR